MVLRFQKTFINTFVVSEYMSAAEIKPNKGISKADHYVAQKNTPEEKIISITNEYSSEMQHSPQIAHPVNVSTDQRKSETIRVDIFQRNENSVFILLTIPANTIIKSVVGQSENGTEAIPQYKVADAYGVSKGFPFDQNTTFQPGDYCMGLVFDSKAEADSITAVKLELQYEEISNLMITQMIFGLYRSFGFDPSHVMKYPVQSVHKSVPFYHKTRKDIEELNKTTVGLREELGLIKETLPEVISNKLQETFKTEQFQNNIYERLDDLKTIVTSREKHVVNSGEYETEKGMMVEQSVSLDEYQILQQERDRYFSKLQEAEDYIDFIMEQREPSHTSPGYFNNAHLSHGTRSLLSKRR